ncbi:hypothetical protein GGP53_002826 [Salinibacter ruber]|nr:hypothetical protein [Salinibacter ruber]MCS4145856.1 hypothetical protein [Salinibacter ruber]
MTSELRENVLDAYRESNRALDESSSSLSLEKYGYY